MPFSTATGDLINLGPSLGDMPTAWVIEAVSNQQRNQATLSGHAIDGEICAEGDIQLGRIHDNHGILGGDVTAPGNH